jgi:hypothetical protein
LFGGDFFHPVGGLAVEHFDDGDVGHGREGCGAVPMLFARREPDDVTRANFLDRSSPTLHPATAASHDERLAQRVRVPRGASAGLEGDTGAKRACRNRRFEQRVNAHRAAVWS